MGSSPRRSLASVAAVLALAFIPEGDAATVTTALDSIGAARQSELALIGTLLCRDAGGRHDLALISENGNDARWFTIGQAIEPDTTLVEVRTRSALVNREGKILELRFSPKTDSATDLPETAPIPALPAHANAFSTPVPGIVPFSETYFRISRALAKNYLHSVTALEDNQAVFLEEGGLFITRLGNEGLLEKAGLRVGDVLTAVDGKPLNNVLDIPRLARLIDSKDVRRIEVELTRHGAPEHLTYDLSE